MCIKIKDYPSPLLHQHCFMQKDLTHGDVFSHICRLAIPIAFTSLLQLAYSFTDMLWIGRLGTDAVTAVGVASFFLHLGWAIASIVIVGTNIKIAHHIGAKNTAKVQSYFSNGLVTLWLITFFYIGIIHAYDEELLSLFNITETNTINTACKYLTYSSWGLLFLFTQQLFAKTHNAHGDTRTPLRISLIAIVTNIFLDPVFIFQLEMGVTGAALASVISQFLAVVLYTTKTHHFLSNPWYSHQIQKQHIISIFKLGTGPSFQYILFSLIAIALAQIISQFGDEAIAAHKIGLQIESLSFVLISSLSSALLAFTGQNYGAQNFERIWHAYQTAIVLSITYGLLISIILIVFSESFISWFVTDPQTIAIGSSYLIIIGTTQIFMCVEMATTGILNGIGSTKTPAIINTSFTLLRLPIALYLTQILNIGVNGVWYAIALSSILRGVFITIAFINYKRKFNSTGLNIKNSQTL